MRRPPAPTLDRLNYTADDMDRLVRVVARHRMSLMRDGHIDHFGREVHPQAPAAGAPPEPPTHQGQCMKCRTKVQARTSKVHDNGPGRAKRAEGPCPTCGTPVHTMVSEADGKKLQEALATTYAYTSGGVR